MTANPILRSIGGVGSAAIVGQLIALGVSPIVSRQFSQAEFGQFGLFFSLANVLVTLATLGFCDALMAPRETADARALMMACTYSVVLTSPVLAGATWLMIRFQLFGYGALPAFSAGLIALEVIAIGMVMLFQMWLIRIRIFRRLAVGYVTQGAVRGSGQVVAGALSLGFLGLGGADVLSRGIVAWVLGHRVRADFRQARQMPVREVARVAWRYRVFPIFRTPSTLAHNLGTAMPPALVTMGYGVASGGLYTLMFGVLVAPAALVQKAVGDVFLGHFAERFHSDPKRARRFLLQVGFALLAISLVPAIVLGCWGEPLFALVFGEKWRAAGTLARLMVPLLMADLAIGPLGSALNVANRPDAKLVFDAMRLTAFASAYFVATRRGLPLPGMITLFAWLGLVAYVVYGALIYFGTKHPRAVIELRGDLQAKSD